jgi:hypothetical protein
MRRLRREINDGDKDVPASSVETRARCVPALNHNSLLPLFG